MSEIWTPPSYRFAGVREARQAVQDYDPNLEFGFNERTKQWCVYLKRGAMAASADADLPILGFDHIPGRDEVQRRLYQSDALRRGHEILDQINRHNDDIHRRSDAVSDEDTQLAETLEWALRKTGRRSDKVFIPGDK